MSHEDLEKLLTDMNLSLPSRGEKDFLEYLFDEIFRDYKDKVKEIISQEKLPEPEKILSTIESKISSLKNACKNYLDGKLDRALKDVSDLLADLTQRQYLSTVKNEDLSWINFKTPQHMPFYRMRKKVPPDQMNRNGFFHLPFELRHKVKAERFSIPGLPCLYFGSSIQVCWNEIGRPDFDETAVAQFKWIGSKEYKLLFLVYEQQDFCLRYIRSDYWGIFKKRLIDLFIAWPLIASTAVKVEHQESNFKPEHIIPQLTMQWAIQEGYDGIVYHCTHFKSEHSFPSAQGLVNSVFPIKKSERTGYCQELSKLFALTQPIMLSKDFKNMRVQCKNEEDYFTHIEEYVSSKNDYQRI